MASNNDINGANGQYSGDGSGFGFGSTGYKSTNAPGSGPSEPAHDDTTQHGQLGSGLPGAFNVPDSAIVSTGSTPSNGPKPPADGGEVSVTSFYKNLESSQDNTVTGTTNTNKEAMVVPDGFGGGAQWGDWNNIAPPRDHEGPFAPDQTGAGQGHAITQHPEHS